ncbi:MAG: hypothetical protein LBM20_06400 [Rikenellaceae bacterium]|nr:hypothetical protein [Rikenellaceae bacterium]
MKKSLLMFLSATLVVFAACVNEDYDLESIDTDNTTIGGDGSEFKIPMVTVHVSLDEISQGDESIQTIFEEADIWLPADLPNSDAKGGYVDIEKMQSDIAYVEALLDATLSQMMTDEAKLHSVATLLASDDYINKFMTLLPGVTEQTFVEMFKNEYQNNATLRELLADEIMSLGHSFLTTIEMDGIEYDIEAFSIDSEVVDMLADNLDPKGTPNAQNTLSMYGTISNKLPVSMSIAPVLAPTSVTFQVNMEAEEDNNIISETRIYADDLRQIASGMTVHIPFVLQKYYPEADRFNTAHKNQLTLSLKLVKRGGLKLN